MEITVHGGAKDYSRIREILCCPVTLARIAFPGWEYDADQSTALLEKQPGAELFEVRVDGKPEGGFWVQIEDGEAEFHTILSPACRGAKAVRAAREVIAQLKARGLRVIGAVPEDLPDAAVFAVAIGFSRTGGHYGINGRIFNEMEVK